jgi:hypothetical protein
MGWKHDLELLVLCYETWDGLAEEIPADVEGDWLRQVYEGRTIKDQTRDGDGIRYKQLPSEDVQEAISEHRELLETAHRAAGETVFRARQMIQKVLHGDPTEEQMRAMQAKLQEYQDDLVWAD